MAIKKPLKTIKEDEKKRNLESINTEILKVSKNKDLIKKVKAWKLPGYTVIKPQKKDEFIKSKPDKKKSNNLDPIIKVPPKKKLDKKK